MHPGWLKAVSAICMVFLTTQMVLSFFYLINFGLCRELAGGVDTLKNVAEILQFIDNICEIKDKAS